MNLQDRIDCVLVILESLKPSQPIDGKVLYDLQLHCSIIDQAFKNRLSTIDLINGFGDTTDMYLMKRRLNHVCHDVVDASCTSGIVLNDICNVFCEFGYELVSFTDHQI